MTTSTPIAYFNILHTASPFNAPQIIERHVFNMTKGETFKPAMKAREILRQWAEKGDRLQTLEGALIRRQGVDLEIIPMIIVPPDGEPVDIFGQWLIPA
jgi:hypothetical protein